MGEFLEYLRTNLHKPPRSKMNETMTTEMTFNQSELGEESDLSDDEKLKDTFENLSKSDTIKLKRFVYELRKMQELHGKKHECGKRPAMPRPKYINNKRQVIQMEIRGVNEPIKWCDFKEIAH